MSLRPDIVAHARAADLCRVTLKAAGGAERHEMAQSCSLHERAVIWTLDSIQLPHNSQATSTTYERGSQMVFVNANLLRLLSPNCAVV